MPSSSENAKAPMRSNFQSAQKLSSSLWSASVSPAAPQGPGLRPRARNMHMPQGMAGTQQRARTACLGSPR